MYWRGDLNHCALDLAKKIPDTELLTKWQEYKQQEQLSRISNRTKFDLFKQEQQLSFLALKSNPEYLKE